MAYNLVGTIGDVSASLSPSFKQPTSAGSLLCCWLASDSGSGTDPFTTSSPGWVIEPGNSGTYGGFAWTAIAYKENCSAGETAPVFSDGGSSDAWSRLGEWTGAPTSSALDQPGTGSGDEVQVATCGSPDSQGGNLILAAGYWNSPGGTATASAVLTDSAGASVTLRDEAPGQPNGSGTTVIDFIWGIAGSSTGSDVDTYTGTLSAFSGSGGVIASFKPGGGSPDSASGAIKLKKMVLSGASAEKAVVTGAIKLKKMVLSGASAEKAVVTGAVKLKKMVLSGASAEKAVVTGAVKLKKMVLSGASAEKAVVTGAVKLKKMVLAGSSTKTVSASGAISLKKMVISGTSHEKTVITGSVKLKKLVVTASGTEKPAITGAIKLKKFVISASSQEKAVITGSIHLNKMRIHGEQARRKSSNLFVFAPP